MRRECIICERWGGVFVWDRYWSTLAVEEVSGLDDECIGNEEACEQKWTLVAGRCRRVEQYKW